MGKIVKISLFSALIIVLFSANSPSQPAVYENSIDFESADIATLVGADGLIMKTTDGGVTWTEQVSGITNVLKGNDIDQLEPLRQIAVGENGIILLTNDGGSQWQIKSSGTLQNLNKVVNNTEYNWIAAGDNGTILKTYDKGETWAVIPSGVTENLNDVFFIGDAVGFIVGNNSTLLKTVDRGETWQSITLTIEDATLTAISMIDDMEGTIVGTNGLIMNTTDGGETWATVNTLSFTADFNDIKYFNSLGPVPVAIAVGNDGAIARSTDKGNTWYGVFGVVSNDFMSVNFGNESNGITVGEEGIELYTYDGGQTWRTNMLFAVPLIDLGEQQNMVKQSTYESSVKLSNFPNPFNPSTNISYELPFDGYVSLVIYDVTGKEVARLINKNFQRTGSYDVEFNGRELSSGVYFYRLDVSNSGENLVKINRMVLTK
jgi:photosystem II stability/assembly factor-like uncharacterized protein